MAQYLLSTVHGNAGDCACGQPSQYLPYLQEQVSKYPIDLERAVGLAFAVESNKKRKKKHMSIESRSIVSAQLAVVGNLLVSQELTHRFEAFRENNQCISFQEKTAMLALLCELPLLFEESTRC